MASQQVIHHAGAYEFVHGHEVGAVVLCSHFFWKFLADVLEAELFNFVLRLAGGEDINKGMNHEVYPHDQLHPTLWPQRQRRKDALLLGHLTRWCWSVLFGRVADYGANGIRMLRLSLLVNLFLMVKIVLFLGKRHEELLGVWTELLVLKYDVVFAWQVGLPVERENIDLIIVTSD